MATNPVTLIEYYKNFKSVSGTLAAATGLGPIISAWLPGAAAAYLFPPLGDVSMAARFGIVVLAAAMTYICFYTTKPAPNLLTRRFILLAAVSVVSLICYLFAFKHFVRRIEDPADNTAIFVSVGYERTGFAEQKFAGTNDWDMLKERGIREQDVSELWTQRSTDIARLCLFTFYGGFLLPLVVIFSLGVRYQL